MARPLLALRGGPAFRRLVRMAVEAGPVSRIVGPVVFAGSWDELGELVRRHPKSPAVVDASSSGDLPSNRLADRDAWFTVMPPLQSGGDALGVTGDAILRAIDPERPRRLQARIREQAAPEAGRIMARVLDRSFGPNTVPALAAGLGLRHWTLLRRCAALGIPTPKKLINLGRVYTVERLAEWSGEPSGVAASALGFLDPSTYRRTVRWALRAPPSVIRQKGGADHVARVIVKSMAPSASASASAPPSHV